jgi:hypothetical protein
MLLISSAQDLYSWFLNSFFYNEQRVCLAAKPVPDLITFSRRRIKCNFSYTSTKFALETLLMFYSNNFRSKTIYSRSAFWSVNPLCWSGSGKIMQFRPDPDLQHYYLKNISTILCYRKVEGVYTGEDTTNIKVLFDDSISES